MRTLHVGGRKGRGDPPAHPDEGDCLLISPAFWIGGALAVLCWVAVLWRAFA